MYRKILLFIVLFLLFTINLRNFAQNVKNPPKADLSTPRQAVITHLKYLQNETYYPELSAKVLNMKADEATKIRYAIKLKQILDGRGLYVYTDSVPNQFDYIDTLSNEYKFVLFEQLPEVYLVRAQGKWVYSIETIQAINRLHSDTYPLGLDYVLETLPVDSARKFLGIDIWKYVIIGLLLVVGFILNRVIRYFFRILLVKLAKRLGREVVVEKFIKPITFPLSVLILVNIFVRVIPVLQFSVYFTKYLLLIVEIINPILIVVILYRFTDYIIAYFEKITEKTENTFDNQLVPFARKMSKISIIVGGGLYILSVLDFNINALVAGISIGGIAVALAAQDTIKHFFGSITIFLDRPFQMGDWIVGGDIDGVVEEVGFRSTRIRTFHNSLIYVPNGKIADMIVDNMGEREYRRYSTKLNITYDTPPILVEIFIKELEQIVLKHPDTRKDFYHIYLNNLGTTSLEIMFYIFFQVKGWSEELKAKHEIILQILRLAQTLGVRFAFPTQTLHIEEMPEKQSLTPIYENLEQSFLEQKILEFWKAEEILSQQKAKNP